MHIDDTTPYTTSQMLQEKETAAALRATTPGAKEENAQHIAALRGDADNNHVAEHIRGMVATTMGNLSVHAPEATRSNAEHWQRWALDVADGVALPVD